MRFTETHEWIRIEGSIGTVGITGHAQQELGDIVYVELPKPGTRVEAGSEAAVLESTKAAADVYSPVAGTIIEVNHLLQEAAELVNSSAEERGWLFKIEFDDATEIEKLLTREAYEAKFE